jgi:hypothetical protein
MRLRRSQPPPPISKPGNQPVNDQSVLKLPGMPGAIVVSESRRVLVTWEVVDAVRQAPGHWTEPEWEEALIRLRDKGEITARHRAHCRRRRAAPSSGSGGGCEGAFVTSRFPGRHLRGRCRLQQHVLLAFRSRATRLQAQGGATASVTAAASRSLWAAKDGSPGNP